MDAYRDYKKNLYILERTELLVGIAEVEAVLRHHLENGDISFLAHGVQFQRYDPSFRALAYYALQEGDEITAIYTNKPLVQKVSANIEKLAAEIELEQYGVANRIRDLRSEVDGPTGEIRTYADGKGSIENTLNELFYRTLTLWEKTVERRYFELWAPHIIWHWPTNYPHVSIATLSLPKFTEEIEAAGRNLGLETHILHRE